ncbi:MAG: hypothetical protein J5876_01145, partial [Lachnospiraceae bacterium]|nr:hypothetical protein [Lachnospiraceae bacterium]
IDADQYSLNTVSVRILDSDGTTVIKQANGNETVPLTRTSGTPGNEGDRATWEGMVEICTEVNGAKLIFIQAIDATGNMSEPVPMEIRYMDCKGPEINITTSNNLDKWSKNKTITVKATDTFGTVYLGTCSEDLQEISNNTYKNTRTYVITGDTSEDKSITFYAKDARGNVTYKTVKFSKLDNTLPTLKAVNVSDVYENGEAVAWKISVNAIDKESGIMGIAITNNEAEPIDTAYKKMTEYIIPRSGKYYVWVKDNVGNVTRSDEIIIHSDLIFNGVEVRNVEYNGVKLNYMYYNGKRIRL